MSTTKKKAVIIGGSGGLGSEIVRVFHGQGWEVAFSHCTSTAAARELAHRLGPAVFTVRADITQAQDVTRCAEEIRQRWGEVHALVNCAGATRDALLVRLREEEWDAVLNVNLRGVFNTLRAFAPLIAAGGHIVNVTSLSARSGRRGQSAYSAAKSALEGLTVSAARELARQGIRVNAVAPGYMATGMGTRAPAAMRKALEESILSVLSNPEEVALFIVHLVTTRSVTGQLFCLDSRLA